MGKLIYYKGKSGILFVTDKTIVIRENYFGQGKVFLSEKIKFVREKPCQGKLGKFEKYMLVLGEVRESQGKSKYSVLFS